MLCSNHNVKNFNGRTLALSGFIQSIKPKGGGGYWLIDKSLGLASIIGLVGHPNRLPVDGGGRISSACFAILTELFSALTFPSCRMGPTLIRGFFSL